MAFSLLRIGRIPLRYRLMKNVLFTTGGKNFRNDFSILLFILKSIILVGVHSTLQKFLVWNFLLEMPTSVQATKLKFRRNNLGIRTVYNLQTRTRFQKYGLNKLIKSIYIYRAIAALTQLGGQGLKKCRPSWLADKENFRF